MEKLKFIGAILLLHAGIFGLFFFAWVNAKQEILAIYHKYIDCEFEKECEYFGQKCMKCKHNRKEIAKKKSFFEENKK